MSSSTKSNLTIAEMRRSDKRTRADTSNQRIARGGQNKEMITKKWLRKYIQKPKQSRRKKKQPEEDQQKHEKYLNIITTPKQLFTLVSNLSEEQHTAVKEIRFGSLFDVKVCGCDAKLIKFLLKRLDVGRCSIQLEDEELCLEEADVQSTLGVSRNKFLL